VKNEAVGESVSGQPGGDPSERVIDQRARNRIIEYLELAASFAAQRKYERAAPIVHVPYEVIAQWEDWVPHLDLVLGTSEVYTVEEAEALTRFQAIWDEAVSALGNHYPPLEDVQAMPAWERLRREAESALAIFARRGKLP
jgi:hypothetical protein